MLHSRVHGHTLLADAQKECVDRQVRASTPKNYFVAAESSRRDCCSKPSKILISNFKSQTQPIALFPTFNMAAIGSLIFCTDCGNLLPPSKGSEKNILHCECCGAENRGMVIGA
jgi:hypothetical protein